MHGVPAPHSTPGRPRCERRSWTCAPSVSRCASRSYIRWQRPRCRQVRSALYPRTIAHRVVAHCDPRLQSPPGMRSLVAVGSLSYRTVNTHVLNGTPGQIQTPVGDSGARGHPSVNVMHRSWDRDNDRPSRLGPCGKVDGCTARIRGAFSLPELLQEVTPRPSVASSSSLAEPTEPSGPW